MREWARRTLGIPEPEDWKARAAALARHTRMPQAVVDPTDPVARKVLQMGLG